MLSSNEGKKLKIAKDENEDAEGESCVPNVNKANYEIPASGTPVNRRVFRRAGPYIIRTEVVGYRPIKSIVQYLAKKEDTDEFYQLKILQLPIDDNDGPDELQAKLLLHTEYSLLSLLQHERGVVKHHGFFSDIALEETAPKCGESKYTGIAKKRLILVLDCLIRHPFCDKSASYISLQEYLSTVKRLSEKEAVYILYEIVKIIESIHEKNVVHRDLKLGNIVLNRTSKQIIITNFCLGKYLINEDVLLNDQWGSPAYISPDVVCGKPYKGKPSDMWALGVVFFMMLFGDFPFFRPTSSALFAQIQAGDYYIPSSDVSQRSIELVKGLLNVDPVKRLTALQMRQSLESLLVTLHTKSPDQLVPFKLKKRRQSANASMVNSSPFGKDDHVVPNVVAPNGKAEKSESPAQSEKAQNSTKRVRAIQIKTVLNRNRAPPINFSMRLNIDNYVDGSTVNLSNNSQMSDSRPSRIQRRSLSGTRSRQYESFTDVADDDLTNEFISLLNVHFASGRIRPPAHGNLREFNGILSHEIAISLSRWLITEFGQNHLVRQIFGNSVDNPVTKVKQLLLRCGVHMEISIFGPKIARSQYIHILLILTYMLKVIGYNNTYFITQLAPSS